MVWAHSAVKHMHPSHLVGFTADNLFVLGYLTAPTFLFSSVPPYSYSTVHPSFLFFKLRSSYCWKLDFILKKKKEKGKVMQ